MATAWCQRVAFGCPMGWNGMKLQVPSQGIRSHNWATKSRLPKYIRKVDTNLTGFDLLILTYFEGLIPNRIDT